MDLMSEHRDSILREIAGLYRDGKLDKAVTFRPDLKQYTDALVKAGHMTRGDDGHLTPGNPHAAWNITVRDWNMPANVVLDNVLQLYTSGQLDQAVANRPDLKRFTDALVTSGHMTVDAGRLVPKIDPNTGWWKRLDTEAVPK